MSRADLIPPGGLQQFALDRLTAHCAAARDGLVPPTDPGWPDILGHMRSLPIDEDKPLAALAEQLALDDGELLTVALCLAADCQPHVARLLAQAQEPVGGSRPLVGLAATLFAAFGLTPQALVAGAAVRSGLLTLGNEAAALPERSLAVPLPVLTALCGAPVPPPPLAALAVGPTPLPPQVTARCVREARWLGEERRCLVLRGASRREGQAVAVALACEMGLLPVEAIPAAIADQVAWLTAARALPCVPLDLGPGEIAGPFPWQAFPGPVVVLAGSDGSVDSGRLQREWSIPLPDEAERSALWQAGGLDSSSAELAASSYRQGAGRIAELAEQARNDSGSDQFGWPALRQAVRGHRSRLDSLARKLEAEVARDDLVLPSDALADLDLLLARILGRGSLADGLGSATSARYRPGVRALFTGESGTGKTLAAHWLAGQTGLPLYRVDQAALTSKWIGETEKNLSAVLDAAQHADVVLFFDEADALFGKRTEVSDANDRHANAQTNFLLQRIEEHEGVVILSTNSRDRFDPAFSRRLDLILPFPMPDVAARALLWRAHLGTGHCLSERNLGALASGVELAGGHIRNIVLGAAVRARRAQQPIAMADILAALNDECTKLGRVAPAIAS